MKNIVLLFVAALSFATTNAQISITSADMPTPGKMPRSSLGDSLTVATLVYANTGANYTWDYSTLVPAFQKIDTFINTPASYTFSFGSATVSRRLPVNNGGGGGMGGITIQSGYEFFKTSSTKFERLGYGGTTSLAPIPLSLANNPKDLVYNLPLQYGTKDTSSSQAILSLSGLIYVEQNQVRYNDVDGWGDITTPYGTFGAMRVKSYITGNDSISYNGFNTRQNRPPSTEYKWLGKGEVVPLLQINTGSFQGGPESVRSVTYRDSLRNVPMVGITEAKLESMQVKTYPNPATESVHFDWNEQLGNHATCIVYDATGKQVYQQNLEKQQVLDLSTLSWQAGTYFVKISGDKKQYSGTLLITK